MPASTPRAKLLASPTAARRLALGLVLAWGCGPAERGLAGTWVRADEPGAGGRRRSLVWLLTEIPGGVRQIPADTLVLAGDGTYRLRMAVTWVALDSAGHPRGTPTTRVEVPPTVDRGQWRFEASGAGDGRGRAGTWYMTHQGVRGWYSAPAARHGDTLVVDTGSAARRFVRAGP